MNDAITYHILVTGKVQGVFYRSFSRQSAEKLNITGWTKNLPDGSVEILACGSPSNLKEFIKTLRQGPESAEVLSVTVEPAPYQTLSHFKITY